MQTLSESKSKLETHLDIVRTHPSMRSSLRALDSHSLDLQSWTALRTIFRGLEKNILLVIAQRLTIKDVSVKKISTWFVNVPSTLCLHLGELSKPQALALASAVLQVNALPRPLAIALFAKCRGHPRFMMEVCELLLAEEKITVEGGTCHVERGDYENLGLPDNIRAVLVSRIDQLSNSEQITLKVASVIGPVFSLTRKCLLGSRSKRERERKRETTYTLNSNPPATPSGLRYLPKRSKQAPNS